MTVCVLASCFLQLNSAVFGPSTFPVFAACISFLPWREQRDWLLWSFGLFRVLSPGLVCVRMCAHRPCRTPSKLLVFHLPVGAVEALRVLSYMQSLLYSYYTLCVISGAK